MQVAGVSLGRYLQPQCDRPVLGRPVEFPVRNRSPGVPPCSTSPLWSPPLSLDVHKYPNIAFMCPHITDTFSLPRHHLCCYILPPDILSSDYRSEGLVKSTSYPTEGDLRNVTPSMVSPYQSKWSDYWSVPLNPLCIASV